MERPSSTASSLISLAKHYHSLQPTTSFLIPSPAPFLPPVLLSQPDVQSALIELILGEDYVEGEEDEEEEGTRLWKRSFWKRVVNTIEDGFTLRSGSGETTEDITDEEVDGRILDQLSRYLSSSGNTTRRMVVEGETNGPPKKCRRTYYFGAMDGIHRSAQGLQQKLSSKGWKRVVTNEEGRMISAGTTGLRTWQASISLSNHLIATPSLVLSNHPNDIILELGAGVGLISLVLARILCDHNSEINRTSLVATDIDEQVLTQLSENIELNGFTRSITASKLDWEISANDDDVIGSSDHDPTSIYAWERQVLGFGNRARLILGADIVYDPTLALDLAKTLAILLRPCVDTPAQPMALIAGTIRNESTWEGFLEHCRELKLKVEPRELREIGQDEIIVGSEGWEGEGEVRLVQITASV